jgi:non-heme chloroperoxidase
MWVLFIILSVILVIVGILAGMIAFGTGTPPEPLASIGKAFEDTAFNDLPAAQSLASRNGSIAFRVWSANTHPQQPELVVIAIHGSSATSHSMHLLAKALSAEGITVYAPDIRGHGGTGRRGDIDYAGQLDDDLADFAAAVRAQKPGAELVLLGLSSGGGFALHIAGSSIGEMFARIVLLTPMLGPYAPTVRPGKSPWVTPYIPRIMGIMLLNQLGIHAFDHLSVLAFGIPPGRAHLLTGQYSFLLTRAFGTLDYSADLRNAVSPLAILVGEKDELFFADKFEPTIKAIRADVPVTIIPDLNHIELIANANAVPAILSAVRGWQ